ncbi:MAG: hypothetical protein IPF55_11760 [Rhodoferax sp.]|nr:hypothetical protein [Rhodoferax sp.]
MASVARNAVGLVCTGGQVDHDLRSPAQSAHFEIGLFSAIGLTLGQGRRLASIKKTGSSLV